MAFAQKFRVSGNVFDADNKEPMIGASIIEKGTMNGVTADFDGNFSLEIDGEKATIQISYIGYKTFEREVTASTSKLKVALESDAHLVDEVVVVAYGVRKKGTIAGSVAVVKGEKLESVPTASFDQALQGQTPGLQVIASSGEPSAAANFQIRGVNSINAGTAPLFIMDGVAISADDFSSINPSDIESISVLKDASSTSIYGARAANGVVVITSKRGKASDNGNINVRAQYGISKLAYGKWNQMNTTERLNYEEEIGLRKAGSYDRELLERTNIDWRNVVYNDAAPFVSVEVSASGASDKYNYYVSGNMFDQEGIAIDSDFKRYTMRANLEAKVNSWFKIGTNTTFAYEDTKQASDGAYTTVTPISASRFMRPYWSPYAEDGSIASVANGTWLGTNVNPLEWSANNPSNGNKAKLLSSVYAEINPIKGLILRSMGGIDFVDYRSDSYSNPSYVPNYGEGSVARSFERYYNLTITNTANYMFDINGSHNFNFLLGQEAVNNQSEGFTAVSRGQTNDKLLNLSAGTTPINPSDMFSGATYLSFFGRGEYNYEGKYYVDFSIRRDGSSRFGKNSRWANFWSVGSMWDISSEDFLNTSSWVNSLQLAASVGTSGNSSIPAYDHLALVSAGPQYGLGGSLPGIAPSSPGNENLTWEKLFTTNVALKGSFFNRLNASVEFYNKNTSDMLMSVPVSVTNGYSYQWENVGSMYNRGVELDFNVDVIRTKSFVWNVNANASYNKNKITSLYDGRDEYELANTNLFLKVGHSYGEFYINRFAGVNPANGDQLWYDRDGNITTEFNENDKVLVGKSYMAPWAGGFGTTMSWKGLSLSAQFSWVADRWMINNDRYFDESNGTFATYNQSKKLLYDRWKEPGDITSIPRHGEITEFDSRLLEDASFLRLKNLTLSYNFDRKFIQKSKIIKNLRIYGQGQNLLTFTKFQGMDPESTANVYQAAYPMTRQFSAGVEVTF